MGRRPRELTPSLSPLHAFGAELRRVRTTQGLSLAALGEKVHISGDQLGKIEKADRRPTKNLCALLDAELSTGGTLLDMGAFLDLAPKREHITFIESSWSLNSNLRVLRELAEGERVDRRNFMALTGAALAATASKWSAATAIAQASAEPGARKLGSSALDRLNTRLADMRVLDDELGGTVLRDLALAEVRWLNGLITGTRLDHNDQKRVLELITEASRLCGWLHLDADRHAAAQAHYVTALRCSASAGDPLIGANVLAGMSFQAMLAGSTAEALSLIDTAEERVGISAPPRLRALLFSRRARAHARAGEAKECAHALSSVENALSAAREDGTDPDWIYFFDEPEMNSQAGACWVDLGKPRRARPLLDDALRSMGPQYVRDRTILLARSARSYFSDGELVRACDDLTAAAELARRTGSVRSIHTIREARDDMTQYSSESALREFDRVFAPTLASIS